MLPLGVSSPNNLPPAKYGWMHAGTRPVAMADATRITLEDCISDLEAELLQPARVPADQIYAVDATLPLEEAAEPKGGDGASGEEEEVPVVPCILPSTACRPFS